MLIKKWLYLSVFPVYVINQGFSEFQPGENIANSRRFDGGHCHDLHLHLKQPSRSIELHLVTAYEYSSRSNTRKTTRKIVIKLLYQSRQSLTCVVCKEKSDCFLYFYFTSKITARKHRQSFHLSIRLKPALFKLCLEDRNMQTLVVAFFLATLCHLLLIVLGKEFYSLS